MTKNELERAVNARISQIGEALAPLDDETAAGLTVLFPPWASGVDYSAGERVQYDQKLYRAVQTHRSQTGWEPPNVPALWTEIAAPGEIPVWKQPTGAQDAYNKGDNVHYPDAAGPVYISDVDGNVWEPTVYGWTLQA